MLEPEVGEVRQYSVLGNNILKKLQVNFSAVFNVEFYKLYSEVSVDFYISTGGCWPNDKMEALDGANKVVASYAITDHGKPFNVKLGGGGSSVIRTLRITLMPSADQNCQQTLSIYKLTMRR